MPVVPVPVLVSVAVSLPLLPQCVLAVPTLVHLFGVANAVAAGATSSIPAARSPVPIASRALMGRCIACCAMSVPFPPVACAIVKFC
ncbi:MAG: hypothetical protein QOE30_4917 [Mycobacterium sp.]|nr:hypothetical protein [Mycobacterium sp.]